VCRSVRSVRSVLAAPAPRRARAVPMPHPCPHHTRALLSPWPCCLVLGPCLPPSCPPVLGPPLAHARAVLLALLACLHLPALGSQHLLQQSCSASSVSTAAAALASAAWPTCLLLRPSPSLPQVQPSSQQPMQPPLRSSSAAAVAAASPALVGLPRTAVPAAGAATEAVATTPFPYTVFDVFPKPDLSPPMCGVRCSCWILGGRSSTHIDGALHWKTRSSPTLMPCSMIT
jgi:hypothetical protein